MKHMNAEKLAELQRKQRFALFLTMLFYLIALFALVSRWPIAYPLIVFSCLYHLISGRLCKKRYTAAMTQALMERAVSGQAVAYLDAEDADGLLFQKGFTPDLPFVPGAKQHHVLHAAIDGVPFSIGEVAFIRKRPNQPLESVGGTLLIADDVLPKEEQWLILTDAAPRGICTADEYAAAGYVQAPLTDDTLPESAAVWTHPAHTAAALPACAAQLGHAAFDGSAMLAARNGSLSLLLVDAYFAPSKADASKPVTDSMLSGFHLPGYDCMTALIRALRAPHD